MPGLRCTVQSCTYSTSSQIPDESSVTDKVALLKIHTDVAHKVTASAPQQQSKAKLDPPKLGSGTSQEQWQHFLRNWEMYKKGMQISDTAASPYLFNCLDKDLQDDVLRARPEQNISEISVDDLKDAIKELAVKTESVLVHRIKLGDMVQTAGVGVRNFLATLKGQAKLCEFGVKCSCNKSVDYSEQAIKNQLIRGLYDKDILRDLLGDMDSKKSLSEVADYVARKEQARDEQSRVSTEATSVIKRQNGNGNQYQLKTCWACLKESHGSNSLGARRNSCSAWDTVCDKCMKKGHITKACSKCSDCNEWGHKSSKSSKCDKFKDRGKKPDDNSVGTLTLGAVKTVMTKKKGSAIPIYHHVFDKNQGWRRTNSLPHPTLDLMVKVCPKDHKNFGHPVPADRDLGEVTHTVITDSGCQSTAVPLTLVYKVGLKKKDLIPVVSKMNGANKSDLGVLGAVIMEFSYETPSRSLVWTRQLCYVCEHIDSTYISREALKELGCIDKNFPLPKPELAAVSRPSDPEPSTACSCPRRASPPPLPTKIPGDIGEDVPRLKEWLLKYYGSSTFNVCDHQPLPSMSGPLLRLHIDDSQPPPPCHKVVPIPIHWRGRVKADIDRDVALGVLQKVPDDAPVKYLSRMIITAKANGDPRRTIDFQPLNKKTPRQTFPLETPFHLASRVPKNVKKTVVDAWNGYHLVPLHPDDYDYTTFVTPWGRYQYKTAPQGLIMSGDGFNNRYDTITADFDDKERCVDDSCLWGKGVKENFLQTCAYLDLCGRNGIVLNPGKFQFCQDTVEFAGLQITNTAVKPSGKLLQSILNFPVPNDITGARAWFGLVNQAAYAFAAAEQMAPFRHLLQPKTQFMWTDELDNLFKQSKQVIVDKITEGVCIFDPNLPTCLATDFSKTGIGFFLLQKMCSCKSKVPTCCKEGWRICLVGSRFLHGAESRYAVIEGEALAIVYGLQSCKYFVLGCRDLTIATDHKPLTRVFNDRSLAEIDNRRLMNLKEKTLPYRFSIQHVPGIKHKGPDAASRYPTGEPERLHLPSEHSTEFDDAPSTKEVRQDILANLSIVEEEDFLDTGLELFAANSFHGTFGTDLAVTWSDLRAETMKDEDLQNLSEMIIDGFPADARKWPSALRPYYPYSASLLIVDGIIMITDRVVIPVQLRSKILSFLHAAHQGIDRMIARASDCLFWPGMTADIAKTRFGCSTCNKIAPSNPMTPPYTPPSPEYPFQYVSADYFHLRGKYYLVLVDRYSHWPTIYSSTDGAKGLISALRGVFSTFGIPEELASDGGTEFTAAETQEFLKNWQVHHRCSSVANPHSNCRAELAVKQVKRIISDNCNASGSLNTDSFHRALLSYRNTPDPVTKFSPARAIFGREVRDGLPLSPGRYNPHPMWQELLDYREKGLAKRVHVKKEAWSEHTRKLEKLVLGDRVFIQNQTGTSPRRWDRTGVVIEVKEYDQFLIKVDGTGRTTLRNRKFLRKYIPTPKLQPETNVKVQPPKIPSIQPSESDIAGSPSPTQSAPPTYAHDLFPNPDAENNDKTRADTPASPPSKPRSPSPAVPPAVNPHMPPAPANLDLPITSDAEPTPVTPGRPSRHRKLNPKYNPDMWDLTAMDTSVEGEIKDYNLLLFQTPVILASKPEQTAVGGRGKEGDQAMVGNVDSKKCLENG